MSFLSISLAADKAGNCGDSVSVGILHEIPSLQQITPEEYSLQIHDAITRENFFQESMFYDRILPMICIGFMVFGIMVFLFLVYALLTDFFKKIFKKQEQEQEEVEEKISYKKIISAARVRRNFPFQV